GSTAGIGSPGIRSFGSPAGHRVIWQGSGHRVTRYDSGLRVNWHDSGHRIRYRIIWINSGHRVNWPNRIVRLDQFIMLGRVEASGCVQA
ncbi:unnamed protein product, partial [Staurois parvus]